MLYIKGNTYKAFYNEYSPSIFYNKNNMIINSSNLGLKAREYTATILDCNIRKCNSLNKFNYDIVIDSEENDVYKKLDIVNKFLYNYVNKYKLKIIRAWRRFKMIRFSKRLKQSILKYYMQVELNYLPNFGSKYNELFENWQKMYNK